MKKKFPNKDHSPAVTFMLEYTVPHANFVDYTNRKAAISNVELQETQEQIQFTEGLDKIINEIVTEVPEQNLDFSRYINYMNRQSAVKNETEGKELTAIFNDRSFHLMESEVKELRKNLIQAKKNQSLLWKGVISFDNDFLKEQGIYDQKTNLVNQTAIKFAVQQSMKAILKKEGLDASAFWWGNIHLNTKHIHVHIGISEVESKRERILYKGVEQVKGDFSQKTLKLMKSQMYNQLLKKNTKVRNLMLEKTIAHVKSEMLEQVSFLPKEKLETFYLEMVIRNLPKDMKWRYGSNAKNFQLSKKYLNKLIQSYYENEGKEDFQSFVSETRKLLKNYQGVYDKKQSSNQLEEQVKERVNHLTENIGNRILTELKNADFEIDKEKKWKVSDLHFLGAEELNELIEEYNQLPLLSLHQKQELGIIKAAFRQRNLEANRVELNSKISAIDKIYSQQTKEDQEYLSMKRQEFSEKDRLTELLQMPKFKISSQEKTEKNRLGKKWINPRKILINKADEKCLRQFHSQVESEKKYLEKLSNPNLLSCFTDKELKEYMNDLDEQLLILNLKHTIKSNNDHLDKTEDPVQQEKIKLENGQLFNQLKKIQQKEKASQSGSFKNEHNGSESVNKDAKSQTNGNRKYMKASVAKTEMDRLRKSQGTKMLGKRSVQLSKSFMSGLKMSVVSSGKREMEAMLKKMRNDERIRIIEEQEEKKKSR